MRGCSCWNFAGGPLETSNHYCHPSKAGGSPAYASPPRGSTGFQPTPSYSQLSVSNVSSRGALPSGATVIVLQHRRERGLYSAAYMMLGNSSVTATTTAGDVIPPNSWMAFSVGSNTYLAGITSSGTTTLILSGGAGLPDGAGGGGGGSGGSVPTGSAGSPNASIVTMQGVAGMTAVKVDGSAVTQPVSGTITANLGTIGSAATASNQTTANSSLSAIATNTTGASTSANQTAIQASAGSDASKAVAVQGVTGGKAVPVSGTFWQGTQPVSLASLPPLATGPNTIGAVTQASGPWTINQTQITGSAVSTVASGVQRVGVVGGSGSALDGAAGVSNSGKCFRDCAPR